MSKTAVISIGPKGEIKSAKIVDGSHVDEMMKKAGSYVVLPVETITAEQAKAFKDQSKAVVSTENANEENGQQ